MIDKPKPRRSILLIYIGGPTSLYLSSPCSYQEVLSHMEGPYGDGVISFLLLRPNEINFVSGGIKAK